MNFLEQELAKAVSQSRVLKNGMCIARAAFGEIGEDIRAKIEFVTLGTKDKYEGVKVTILNRREGVIDSAVLRLKDIWGMQRVGQMVREVEPHIWTYNDNYEWYGFNPKRADYDKLTIAIDRYLSVFQDMSMVSQVSENAMQFKS